MLNKVKSIIHKLLEPVLEGGEMLIKKITGIIVKIEKRLKFRLKKVSKSSFLNKRIALFLGNTELLRSKGNRIYVSHS